MIALFAQALPAARTAAGDPAFPAKSESVSYTHLTLPTSDLV